VDSCKPSPVTFSTGFSIRRHLLPSRTL
jgi:hypothetical protein